MFNDSFEVGDIVSPLKTIRFTDGTKHNLGQEYVVDVGTVSYYNVQGCYYKLIRSVKANEPTVS